MDDSDYYYLEDHPTDHTWCVLLAEFIEKIHVGSATPGTETHPITVKDDPPSKVGVIRWKNWNMFDCVRWQGVQPQFGDNWGGSIAQMDGLLETPIEIDESRGCF